MFYAPHNIHSRHTYVWKDHVTSTWPPDLFISEEIYFSTPTVSTFVPYIMNKGGDSPRRNLRSKKPALHLQEKAIRKRWCWGRRREFLVGKRIDDRAAWTWVAEWRTLIINSWMEQRHVTPLKCRTQFKLVSRWSISISTPPLTLW